MICGKEHGERGDSEPTLAFALGLGATVEAESMRKRPGIFMDLCADTPGTSILGGLPDASSPETVWATKCLRMPTPIP